MRLSVKELVRFTGGTAENVPESVAVCDIVTDSRKITYGCLFVAIRGEKFDGHAFVNDAIQKGAFLALVDGSFENNCGLPVIRTDDTLKALGNVAKGYKETYFPKIRTVAVTGSVGKTSTKEMVAKVLEASYSVRRTPLNFNNEIGLPMTVLSLESGQNCLVAEMGMRGFRQIEYLQNIASPDMAVITNIGVAHMEILGSRENILKAKMEVTLSGRNKSAENPFVLAVNGDNDMLCDRERLRNIAEGYGCRNIAIYTFGQGEKCDFRACDIRYEEEGTHFTVKNSLTGTCSEIEVPLPGEHNVYNALAAFVTGTVSGIAPDALKEAILSSGERSVRQNIIRLDGITVIDDAYNAGPESMKASLGVLRGIKADIHMAALGDMLELGSVSEKAHMTVGSIAGEFCRYIVTAGTMGEAYRKGAESSGNMAEVRTCSDSFQAGNAILELIKNCKKDNKTAAVLVKGSHAIEMEKVTAMIKGEYK